MAAADTTTRLRYAYVALVAAGIISWSIPFAGAVIIVACGAFVSLSNGAYLAARKRYFSAGVVLLAEKIFVLAAFMLLSALYGATYLTLPWLQGTGALVGGTLSLYFYGISFSVFCRYLTTKPVKLWHSFYTGISTVSPSVMLLDVTVVLFSAGAFQAGLYAAASRLVAPLNVLATSVTAVVLPRAATSGRRRINVSWTLRSASLAALALAALVVTLVAADWWVPFLLGDEYVEATWVVRLALLNVLLIVFCRVLVAVIQGWNDDKFAAGALAAQVALALVLVLFFSAAAGAAGASLGVLLANSLLALTLVWRLWTRRT
ncbi:hypothetical protein [Pseudarthrobacter sp. NS4]|uniref:hypothetical protein n=1 Tax=Pseudarthrobacter sp. NS4 TaxID=2973976 RepID=UPI002161A28A|nr:hypothetical protein [Pseudarthrobacter sp. NS4]